MSNLRKKTSMQDIADLIGISKYSVSLALNGKNGVSDETRALVVNTAKKMNYGGLAPEVKESDKILVLIPGYIRDDSYFYNKIYWTIEEHAKCRGHIAILTTVSDRMQQKNEMPALFYEMDFKGIILVGVLDEKYVAFIARQIRNVVSIDQYYYEVELNCILTANNRGSYAITKHVIGQGHSKIGFVGPILMTTSIFDRWSGYKRALLDSGLDIDPDYSVLGSSPLGTLLSDAVDLANRLKKMPKFPTAWVCGGDRIAFTLYEALKSLGVKVPDDVSVAGFDNLEASEIIQPSLTTVDVKRELLGTLAVDRIIDMAAGPRWVAATSIYADIVIRESVRPPGGKTGYCLKSRTASPASRTAPLPQLY